MTAPSRLAPSTCLVNWEPAARRLVRHTAIGGSGSPGAPVCPDPHRPVGELGRAAWPAELALAMGNPGCVIDPPCQRWLGVSKPGRRRGSLSRSWHERAACLGHVPPTYASLKCALLACHSRHECTACRRHDLHTSLWLPVLTCHSPPECTSCLHHVLCTSL